MPTKLERRLELLENLLIAGTAGGTAGYLGYQVGARGAAPAARAVAVTPVGRAALAASPTTNYDRRLTSEIGEAFAAADTSPEAQKPTLSLNASGDTPRQGLYPSKQQNELRKRGQLARPTRPLNTLWPCLKRATKVVPVRTKVSYRREPSKWLQSQPALLTP